MRIESAFYANADRYRWDDQLTSGNGYAQIDSEQDAFYYGAWCSPFDRKVVTYAEGDLTTATADTDDEFVAYIRRMDEASQKTGRGALRIDPWFSEALRERFEQLGLGDLLH